MLKQDKLLILKEKLSNLYEAMNGLRDEEEFKLFFDDLCTPAELEAMADRWLVVLKLEEGMSYRLINEETSVSTATITRVARALEYGEGYRLALKKQKKKVKNVV